MGTVAEQARDGAASGLAGDVRFNNTLLWSYGIRPFEVDFVGAVLHELGHSLGIHHTDKNFGGSRRPTMYSSYFGVQGRSLESDDKSALRMLVPVSLMA